MTDSPTISSDTHSSSVDAFQRFAIAAEQIAATTKRLVKAAILGDYFTSLEDDDLRLAARYFAGSPFPQFDQRVLQVGGSALMAALLEVSGAELDTLQAELVRRGDLGDVAGDVLPDSVAPTLRLPDVGKAFASLVEIRGNKRKVEGIIRLLQKQLR